MSALKNFVAVDWRSGKDRIYFFFKDTNTYSRFDLGENKVADGYPKKITEENWGSFHAFARNLRFGFTTTGIWHSSEGGDDRLWLFFYDDKKTPMVCEYNQDLDQVTGYYRLENSVWYLLAPYFDRIIAGTWWDLFAPKNVFRFLMNDGNYLSLNQTTKKISVYPVTQNSWPGLAPYQNRIITAAQNDEPLIDTYYYIFLTNNEYIRYNLKDNRAEISPKKIDEESWPGLLRD